MGCGSQSCIKKIQLPGLFEGSAQQPFGEGQICRRCQGQMGQSESGGEKDFVKARNRQNRQIKAEECLGQQRRPQNQPSSPLKKAGFFAIGS